jgi:hypothetical protein
VATIPHNNSCSFCHATRRLLFAQRALTLAHPTTPASPGCHHQVAFRRTPSSSGFSQSIWFFLFRPNQLGSGRTQIMPDILISLELPAVANVELPGTRSSVSTETEIWIYPTLTPLQESNLKTWTPPLPITITQTPFHSISVFSGFTA